MEEIEVKDEGGKVILHSTLPGSIGPVGKEEADFILEERIKASIERLRDLLTKEDNIHLITIDSYIDLVKEEVEEIKCKVAGVLPIIISNSCHLSSVAKEELTTLSNTIKKYYSRMLKRTCPYVEEASKRSNTLLTTSMDKILSFTLKEDVTDSQFKDIIYYYLSQLILLAKSDTLNISYPIFTCYLDRLKKDEEGILNHISRYVSIIKEIDTFSSKGIEEIDKLCSRLNNRDPYLLTDKDIAIISLLKLLRIMVVENTSDHTEFFRTRLIDYFTSHQEEHLKAILLIVEDLFDRSNEFNYSDDILGALKDTVYSFLNSNVLFSLDVTSKAIKIVSKLTNSYKPKMELNMGTEEMMSGVKAIVNELKALNRNIKELTVSLNKKDDGATSSIKVDKVTNKVNKPKAKFTQKPKTTVKSDGVLNKHKPKEIVKYDRGTMFNDIMDQLDSIYYSLTEQDVVVKGNVDRETMLTTLEYLKSTLREAIVSDTQWKVNKEHYSTCLMFTNNHQHGEDDLNVASLNLKTYIQRLSKDDLMVPIN